VRELPLTTMPPPPPSSCSFCCRALRRHCTNLSVASTPILMDSHEITSDGDDKRCDYLAIADLLHRLDPTYRQRSHEHNDVVDIVVRLDVIRSLPRSRSHTHTHTHTAVHIMLRTLGSCTRLCTASTYRIRSTQEFSSTSAYTLPPPTWSIRSLQAPQQHDAAAATAVDAALVQRIARLSKLAVSESELPQMRADLARMLQSVQQVRSVDTDGVEALVSLVEQAPPPPSPRAAPLAPELVFAHGTTSQMRLLGGVFRSDHAHSLVYAAACIAS